MTDLNLHLIDRKTAAAHGLARYFTGKPCPRGNIAARLVRAALCLCPGCIELRRGGSRRYVAKLRAERMKLPPKPVLSDEEKRAAIKQRSRERYLANREQRLERDRLYYQANKDRVNARNKARRRKAKEQ